MNKLVINNGLFISILSINKVSQYNVRPPEFCVGCFTILEIIIDDSVKFKKLTQVQLLNNLIVTVNLLDWIGGVNQEVTVRRKTPPESLCSISNLGKIAKLISTPFKTLDESCRLDNSVVSLIT